MGKSAMMLQVLRKHHSPIKIMSKILSIALLVAGIIILIFGLNASDSISSTFFRLFTGNPTDKAIWLIIGGAVLCALSLVGLLRGSKP